MLLRAVVASSRSTDHLITTTGCKRFFVCRGRNMQTIMPVEEVKTSLSKAVACEQYGLNQYADIVRLAPADITGLALNAWNRLVHGKNPPRDKYAIKKYITIHDAEAG